MLYNTYYKYIKGDANEKRTPKEDLKQLNPLISLRVFAN